MDSINFQVWNDELTQIYRNHLNKEAEGELADSDDDFDDDSGDELSTSSSFSSLNEFVEEMCNANRINSEFISK